MTLRITQGSHSLTVHTQQRINGAKAEPSITKGYRQATNSVTSISSIWRSQSLLSFAYYICQKLLQTIRMTWILLKILTMIYPTHHVSKSEHRSTIWQHGYIILTHYVIFMRDICKKSVKAVKRIFLICIYHYFLFGEYFYGYVWSIQHSNIYL